MTSLATRMAKRMAASSRATVCMLVNSRHSSKQVGADRPTQIMKTEYGLEQLTTCSF